MSCILSDHNGIKLEINSNRTGNRNHKNIWRWDNDQSVIEEIRGWRIFKFLESNKNKNTIYQNFWKQQSQF
jgi:hypothetical protein